jgi:hypothetical protein
MVTSKYKVPHDNIFYSQILHSASKVKKFSSAFLKSLLSAFPPLILKAKLGTKYTFLQ